MNQTKSLELKITGMHCAGCVGSVESALKKVKGVDAGTALNAALTPRYVAKIPTKALKIPSNTIPLVL
ncbi:MAG: hypothetical protein HOK94_07820 [Candidatus Marinimicrobia bacterium]|jgi:copper chaperone CopZ|nr:hypothetical protein [Candidatus Neomarinimicrobiota bacterium]